MPPILLIFHTIAFSLALYFALPFMQINWTPLVFSGVGILFHTTLRSTDQLKILPDLKLLGEEAGFEVRLDDNLDLQLGPAHLSHQRNHSEWQRDVLCGAVPENRNIELEELARRETQANYLISSCSPSGGMKLMACSVSNLLSLTHLSR